MPTVKSSPLREGKRLPLANWLWRSYLRAALIPLLVIELSFLGLYWAANQFTYASKVDLVSELSNREMSSWAENGARSIAEQLHGITDLTQVYADQTALAFSLPADVSPEEKSRMAYTEDGMFYSTFDNGGSAVYYSGFFPVGEAEQDKVWRTTRLDPLMKSIVDSNPMIAQIYLNTWDSYNRIYPYFDVASQYPSKMDIASYNFYYDADAEHNPDRNVVWTGAYVDPAGSGWMVSAIAPSYVGDTLEAVVGIDITIDTIVNDLLDVSLPWDGYAILISRDGTILAMPEQGEVDFGMSELTSYSYQEAIHSDTFKPSDFNIFRRGDTIDLATELEENSQGSATLTLQERMAVSWAEIPGVGWKVLVLTPENEIYAESIRLRKQLDIVALLMLGSLFVFYIIFFVFLWRRAEIMSRKISAPLEEIAEQFSDLTTDNAVPPTPDYQIKELQSVGENLVVASHKIDEANKTKSQFMANISHELRTPMNGVLGMTELLSDTDLQPKQRKMLETIEESSHLLLTIINDILDFSRIEAGKLAIDFKLVEIADELEQLTKLLNPLAERSNVQLVTSFDADATGIIETDPIRLRQILMNLVGNAVKFSARLPNRIGKVEINTHRTAKNDIVIEIKDNGIGISEDALKHLFQPFYQVEAGLTRNFGGAGLGLTISSNLAHLLGGEITVNSTEGVGSTFSLRLPSRRN